MKRLILGILIAAALWFLMFSPLTGGMFNFWAAMSISAAVLIGISFLFNKNFWQQFSFSLKDCLIGVVSAVVLWGVFYAGDYFSSLLFDFAKPQVHSIYQLRDGQNPLYIALLLLFLIGPAEEIFWRGYVQRTIGKKYGEWVAVFAATAIYALAHVWAGNFMLVMAALVCGGFWALIYKWNKNIVTVIISHAIWDVMVFVLFPIK